MLSTLVSYCLQVPVFSMCRESSRRDPDSSHSQSPICLKCWDFSYLAGDDLSCFAFIEQWKSIFCFVLEQSHHLAPSGLDLCVAEVTQTLLIHRAPSASSAGVKGVWHGDRQRGFLPPFRRSILRADCESVHFASSYFIFSHLCTDTIL